MYSRIKVIHKVNGGLVSARQAGVAVATGEYIACIDGDDWISEDFFAKFAEVIDRFHIDVACCGAVWVYEHKEIRKTVGVRCGYYHREQIEKEIFPILIEGSNGVYFAPSLWAKVFKRDIYYQQQLVDAVVSIGEDIACVKPCIFHSKSMYVFNDTLYYYRQNPTSMTKKKKALDLNGPRIIGKHLEKHIDMTKLDFHEQVYRFVVHNLFIVCVSQFNKPTSYHKSKVKILATLNEEYYKNAINQSIYYKNLKGKIAHIALKNKYMLLLWLFNKIK